MKFWFIAAYFALCIGVVAYMLATIDREPDDLDGGQE